MKKYILPLILILLLTFTLIGNCAWLAGWDYRIELEIADYAGDIGAEVTWFPVEVFLTATQCEEVFVELTTDEEYKKVAFTKADGITELYAEKELFDVSEELGIYHVSRDGWTINANTSIYMYYDKDHADNTTYINGIGTVTAQSVWDANFKLVYHMVDLNTSAVKDSTSNNNNGTKKDVNEPIEATGEVGKGQDFDGINDYIVSGINIGISSSANRTVEAIVNTSTNQNARIINFGEDATGKEFGFLLLEDELWKVALRNYDRVWNGVYLNAAHHLAVVLDGTDASDLTGYFDGSVANVSSTVDGTINTTNAKVYVGSRSSVAGFFDGVIDEVRVSNTNRSAAWIKGTYNTLWDTLLTYGSEETEEAEEVNALFWSNF